MIGLALAAAGLGTVVARNPYVTYLAQEPFLARKVAMVLGLNLFDPISVSDYLRHLVIGPGPDGKPAGASLPPIMGPLRRSLKNPRYFADSTGRLVYLTGMHTWLNFVDEGYTDPPRKFDFATYLRFLQRHGHNFTRLWVWEQSRWSVEDGNSYYTPSPYQRTGPGKALDGKPKFDLTKFNQSYFDRMRRRVMAARDKGIYVSIMLFNGWSVSYPKGGHRAANPWRGHPYNRHNNINGIAADANGDGSGAEVHELLDPRVTALQEGYVRKVVDTVNDLDNVLFEISNESDARSVAWQYHMIDFIHAYERTKPKQHPVGMTAIWPNGRNQWLYDSNADWIAPTDNIESPPATDGKKVVLFDTDHLCGLCGTRRFVWRAFTRGGNPVFMDRYDKDFGLHGPGYDLAFTWDRELRINLGYSREWADRLDLAAMTPHGALSSTGYCLANPAASGAAYFVYLPNGGKATVDLSATPGRLRVTWFDPDTGRLVDGGEVGGGGQRSFDSPLRADAILYLGQKK